MTMSTDDNIVNKDINSQSIFVELLCGPMDGSDYRCDKNEIIVGRDPQQDVAIPLDKQVSRNHARIYRHNDKWFVQDMNSKHGTFLNGVKIESETAIDDSDIIKVGSTELRVSKA